MPEMRANERRARAEREGRMRREERERREQREEESSQSHPHLIATNAEARGYGTLGQATTM
jgi:hypothetical protein